MFGLQSFNDNDRTFKVMNIFQQSESEPANLFGSSAAESSMSQIPKESAFSTPKLQVQHELFQESTPLRKTSSTEC